MTPEQRKELEETIEKMTLLKDSFYSVCQREALPHTFLEFAGLMHEYTRICQDALERDIDFISDMSRHARDAPMAEIRLGYLGEKWECIFHEWLGNEGALRAFLESSGISRYVQMRQRIGAPDVP
jgi:hypothetical protein